MQRLEIMTLNIEDFAMVASVPGTSGKQTAGYFS
jgi:hypothetical protein